MCLIVANRLFSFQIKKTKVFWFLIINSRSAVNLLKAYKKKIVLWFGKSECQKSRQMTTCKWFANGNIGCRQWKVEDEQQIADTHTQWMMIWSLIWYTHTHTHNCNCFKLFPLSSEQQNILMSNYSFHNMDLHSKTYTQFIKMIQDNGDISCFPFTMNRKMRSTSEIRHGLIIAVYANKETDRHFVDWSSKSGSALKAKVFTRVNLENKKSDIQLIWSECFLCAGWENRVKKMVAIE